MQQKLLTKLCHNIQSILCAKYSFKLERENLKGSDGISVIGCLAVLSYQKFNENDKTFEFKKHVSTETSVIFS